MYLIFREFGVGDAIEYYDLNSQRQIVIESFLSYYSKEVEEANE